MQQVQDGLDFKIDTPSDKELQEQFEKVKHDPMEALASMREKLVGLSMKDRSKSHAKA